MLSPSIVTFTAAVGFAAGTRLKFNGADTTQVTPAGPDDAALEIGTAILHNGRDYYAAGTLVGVALNNHPGTRTTVAGEAFAAGAILRRTASGKVGVSGTGTVYGTALEASSAAGDFVETMQSAGSSHTVKSVVVNGVNSTGAAANIAAVDVVATDAVVEVIDLTTPAKLDAARFTAGAGVIVQAQAQAAGDLSTKKLLIRLHAGGI